MSKDYVSQFLLAGFSGKGFKPLYASSVTADPHSVAATFGSLAKVLLLLLIIKKERSNNNENERIEERKMRKAKRRKCGAKAKE